MRYLTVEEVLLIHNYLLKFGGADGILSINLLESAIYRPSVSFNGLELYADLFHKTAVLFYSIIKNHPFVDGNKRTAFVCAVFFLEFNGKKVSFSKNEVSHITLNTATGRYTIADLAELFKGKSRDI